MGPENVLAFWFGLSSDDWFNGSAALDAEIASRFSEVHAAASRCELWGWRALAAGRLAEIIVLDQFSRNLFRNDGRAFAQDSLALGLAQEAVALGVDAGLSAAERSFLYMPYMHSESSVVQSESLRLFAGLPDNLEFARKHKATIDRFGRYPHRNLALGRKSTAEELLFLAEPG